MCRATFARVLMAPMVVLCVAAPVAAADPPKEKIGISYSVLRLPGGTMPLGWVVARDGNVTNWMAVVAEIGANYKRIGDFGILMDHAALGGIKITSRANRSVAPFVQVLAGVSILGVDLSDFGARLVFQPGAGVDIRIGAKAALRLQGDYRTNGSSVGGGGDFRTAVGLVYGVGKR